MEAILEYLILQLNTVLLMSGTLQSATSKLWSIPMPKEKDLLFQEFNLSIMTSFQFWDKSTSP